MRTWHHDDARRWLLAMTTATTPEQLYRAEEKFREVEVHVQAQDALRKQRRLSLDPEVMAAAEELGITGIKPEHPRTID